MFTVFYVDSTTRHIHLRRSLIKKKIFIEHPNIYSSTFVVTKKWKQSGCPSLEEKLNKL